MTRFSGRLPPVIERPVSGGEFEFGVAFVECLRSSMAVVKRREMCEAGSHQRQGVYTAWPRGGHSAGTWMLTLVRIISHTACFPYPGSKTDLRYTTSSTIRGDRIQRWCNPGAVVIQVVNRPIDHILGFGNARHNRYGRRHSM